MERAKQKRNKTSKDEGSRRQRSSLLKLEKQREYQFVREQKVDDFMFCGDKGL